MGSVLLFLHVGETRLTELEIDVSKVKKLVELVEKHNLQELTVEEDDLCVTIKGSSPSAHLVTQPPTQPTIVEHECAPEASDTQSQPEPRSEEKLDGNVVDIVAPLVGVFYRSPAPDAPPFVEVGDTIEVGTEVGLIEAMKVFSPIPSEVAGEVVEILADNGKLVQQGEVLVRVKVAES
ncbi:MAG: acetyl-CoA carboxylase biotin carboxyl carrier protein [Armatimonadetes bacterium]|nr:acetyl-CoA carboxylase biotin carboxyl carrier protein [Armatimonadota bacterium]